MSVGSVYLLETSDERYVKIGFTSRMLWSRLEEIQRTMFAYEHGGIRVIGFFPASQDIESALHRHFGYCRFHGDWYERGAVLDGFADAVAATVIPPQAIRGSMNALEMQRAGGRACAASMTPEQRTERARKAINARWSKRGTERKPAKVNQYR